jgi:hypothetical protein
LYCEWGGVAVRREQKAVEPVLGIGKGRAELEPERPETRRPDRNQERGHGLRSLLQIFETASDEVLARKIYITIIAAAASPGGRDTFRWRNIIT